MLDSYISTRIQPGCRRISGITSFRHFSLNSSSFGTLSSSVLAFDLAAFHSGMLKKSVLSSNHGMVLYQVTMMPPRGASPLRYNDATVRNFAAEVFSGSTTPGLILNIFQNGSGMQG